jgi:hypothetical protein
MEISRPKPCFFLITLLPVILVAVISGCSIQAQEEVPTKTSETRIDEPYPAPDIIEIEPYPAPLTNIEITSDGDFGDIPFSIEKPLITGSTIVEGSGPVGIQLQVVDITMGGNILGTGSIDDNNKFVINLASPVGDRRLIGIALSEPRQPDTWLALWELRSNEARAIPELGYFFDTVITETQ